MKPLYLIIEGVRSFSDRVEINFEEISRGGLFGIFGSTGSGKSSILDSIILALYGKLNKREMGEVVNVRKKSAFVSLLFEICYKGERKRYLVERSFKLKKDSSYSGATASLYNVCGGQLISVASLTGEVNQKIEDIIGLGINEFTKCIILPQGEFSQFVKSTKAERVKIIEKLFGLEKYGEKFFAKLKRKQAEIDKELSQKKGELSQYESVTKEALDIAKKEMEECSKLYEEENGKYLKIKDYIEKNQEFYTLHNQLVEDQKELDLLIEREGEIQDKKKFVSLYEKAKLVEKANAELNAFREQLDNVKRLFDCAKEERDLALKQKEQAELEQQSLDQLSKDIKEADFRYQKFLDLTEDYEKRKDLFKKIAEKKASIFSVEEKIENLNKNIQENQRKVDDIQKEINILEQTLNLEVAFSCVANVALSKEYDEQSEYYKDFKNRLSKYEDKSTLFGFVDESVNAKILEYQNKKNSIENSNGGSLEEEIENYEKTAKKVEVLNDNLNALSKKISQDKTDLAVLKQEVENAKSNLNNEQILLEELTVKLLKICDNIDDFYVEKQIAKNVSEDLLKKQEKIKKNYEETSKEYEKKREAFENAKTDYEKANSVVEHQTKILQDTFVQGVESVEVAKKILSTGLSAEDIQAEIFEYEKKLSVYKYNVELASKKLKKSKFDHQEYLQNLAQLKKSDENRTEFLKNFEKSKNSYSNLSQNFEKRCIIEEEFNKIYARAQVLERLEQLTKGKAFSEFVAAEFLYDVCDEAKKLLIDLTGGQYEILYQEANEGDKDGFIVVDNLHGGIKRTVSTLSGGETFLVSLALALALSSSIYADSDRPMEFFFLDEGFGTLDEKLVETVLDILEKLRNKNFSIGLISHLSEMKSRIDSKITVIPATETKGSTIVVNGITL